jgi:hypothetical protein
MSTRAFYTAGAGDRLIDTSLLSARVRDFLDGELQVLTRLAARFDVLVEVGSMSGLHLGWAADHDKGYLGLDIVERYIEAGRRRVTALSLAAQRYRFTLMGAERLAEAERPAGLALAFFPFNSFGNMDNPIAVLDAVVRSGTEFLISSYGTDARSNEIRLEYYNACGFTDLDMREDSQGVRFSTSDGLNTVAYHEDYLLDRMIERGLDGSAVRFAEFGRLYMSRSLAVELRAPEVPER